MRSNGTEGGRKNPASFLKDREIRSLKGIPTVLSRMQPRDLSSHQEYVPGRGVEEVAAAHGMDPADLVTLSSNENPLGPSDAAIDAIASHVDSVHRYPKASHLELTDALADHWNLDRSQVWVASGGDGALDYLSRAVLEPGDRVLVPRPGFAYYGMSARFHHGDVDTYELSQSTGFEMTAPGVLGDYDGHRIVYVTSPHNPTGRTMALDELEMLAEQTDEETLVVVDEAYGEFADTGGARELLDGRDDIAVLRSFSKAYGLAGLRLGYALVPEAWGDAYIRVNTPFAVNELACRAGVAALGASEHLERGIDLARWGRTYLGEELSVHTWPSEGNFVLVDVGDASRVAAQLIPRGYIVRDCTSFGLPSCIRITIGRQEATRGVATALDEVAAEVANR